MQVQSTRLPAGDSQDTADSDIDFVRSKVDVPGHNSLTRYEIKSIFFVCILTDTLTAGRRILNTLFFQS